MSVERSGGVRKACSAYMTGFGNEHATEAEAGALPGAVLDTSDDASAYATAERLMDVLATGAAVLVEPPD